MVLSLREIQTTSPTLWTWFAVSISFDANHCTTNTWPIYLWVSWFALGFHFFWLKWDGRTRNSRESRMKMLPHGVYCLFLPVSTASETKQSEKKKKRNVLTLKIRVVFLCSSLPNQHITSLAQQQPLITAAGESCPKWPKMQRCKVRASLFLDAQCILFIDYLEKAILALLANTPNQAETLLHSLERAAAGIGLHVNANKTEYMCYNQTGNIATLDGASLKLVDKFTYLGSSVSSTEKDIDTRLTKAWTAIDRLSIIWKSDLTDKMKRSFFQAAVVSILLYGCTTWTLTKRLERRLDGNYTRMLRAVLNKSWRQHPTRLQLYGHLPPITKTIQVRRTRHAGHCWRSKDELISDVLLWTPTHGCARVGRPARTYIQQLCEDTGCNPEDLPEAMNDREKWRETVRDIRAGGATWWWYSITDAFVGRNRQKAAANEEVNALSTRQCTVSQVDRNDGKTTWIALRIVSALTLFSRSGPQWLLTVCKPKKNAPEKKIWQQWKRDIRNWGVFWGQRQIVQQKGHRIVREALESVYHPRRKLCWIKSNFVKKLLFY